MSKLIVYYNERIVGNLLFDHEERLSFQYDPSWLSFDESFPLSLALALSDKIYGHLETKSFFENLLPEGEIKDLLEAHGKSSIKSEFGFLQEFGGDCAGSFKILPEKVKPQKVKASKKELKLQTIYKYLEEKKSLTDVMLNVEGGRFSLAGAQDKFAVLYEDGKIFLPQDGTPTSHIIKPPVRFYKSTHDSPYNEYFCMKLAAQIGLSVPDVQVIEGKYPLFLVERFDRTRSISGELNRIHQQDFCQAHGITSLKKYENDGGPSFKDNYNLVKKYSSNPIVDLNQLLMWLMFNLLIGNNDSHSKNLALINTISGLRVAPFYDLLSTSVYKEIGHSFSFKIGGQLLWYKLNKRLVDKFSKELELKEDVLPKIGLKVIHAIEKDMPKLIAHFNSQFKDIQTATNLEKEITKRLNFFRKIFD